MRSVAELTEVALVFLVLQAGPVKTGSKCAKDGYYYHNHYSIILCSNGNSYKQECAPGTLNKEKSHYEGGYSHSRADFCNVNLNDYGYGASRPHHGYGYSYHQREPNYHEYGYKHDHHRHEHEGYGEGHQGYGHHGYYPIKPRVHYPYAHFPPIEHHHEEYH